MHNQLTQSSDAGDKWSTVEMVKYCVKGEGLNRIH